MSDYLSALVYVDADGRPHVAHATPTHQKRNPIGRVMRKDEFVHCYGEAVVKCNGRVHIDGERPPRKYRDKYGYCRVRHAEKAARRNPRAVWEIHLCAPLWEAVFRRRPSGAWVCISHGEGFA